MMRKNNYVAFIYSFFKAKLFNKSIPLSVILCVTNKCNLNCWYCYGEHHYRTGCEDFSKDEIFTIIDQLSLLGTKIIQFQGGEPFLREDLKDIIKYAKKKKMICDLVTNGTLTEGKKDIFKLLDKLCISIDGKKELHDFNRGKNTHAKAVSTAIFARKLLLPVRISAVLTDRTSSGDIDWLLDFSYQNNISVNFAPSFEFVSRFSNQNNKPHEIEDEKLKNIFNYIIEKKKKFKRNIQFSDKSYFLAKNWPFSYNRRMVTVKDKESLRVNNYPKCYHGKYVIFIDSDGFIYPCCNFWGKSKLNIKKITAKEALKKIDNNCRACYMPSYIDRNLFFSGNINVWINYIIQALKGVL